MRRIMLVTALGPVSPLAYAQSMPGTASARSGIHRRASPIPPLSTRMAGQPDPENCGTPDEPKACPPMPRHPLPYHPNNK